MIPGERYTIKLEARVPDDAVSADAGLYANGRQLASLKAGAAVVAEIPPSAGDRLRLELRSQGWVPKKAIAGSDDTRTLGIQVSAITMSSASAGTNVFDANTGGTVAR